MINDTVVSYCGKNNIVYKVIINGLVYLSPEYYIGCDMSVVDRYEAKTADPSRHIKMIQRFKDEGFYPVCHLN